MAKCREVTSRLESARRIFVQKIAATKAQWQDSVEKNFEKNYEAPLPGQIKIVQQELERLGQLIEQAKRDVK